MNIRELKVWANKQPEDMTVYFHTDGCAFAMEHAIAVPEWKVAYIGVDEDDLKQSLEEEMSMSEVDPNDRDAFIEALEADENKVELEGDPTTDGVRCCAIEGGTAAIEAEVVQDPATGVM
jgi:SPX domain-containing protein involved in vacuolar polyphosphate accumulation